MKVNIIALVPANIFLKGGNFHLENKETVNSYLKMKFCIGLSLT